MHGANDILPYIHSENNDKDDNKKKVKIDRVIYITGNERMNETWEKPNRQEKKQQQKRHMEKMKQQRVVLIDLLGKWKIGLDFLVVDRPLKSVLSATKFIEAIKRGENHHKLAFFMPENLPKTFQKEIIDALKISFSAKRGGGG